MSTHELAEQCATYALEIMRLKEKLDWAEKGLDEWRDLALKWMNDNKRLQQELGECSGGFETVCKEADALKKTAAVLANNCADLRAALRTIRDATHTNAVTMRGMADMALKE